MISVEPDPLTFEALMTNLELNGCRNVLARNIAATATKCKVIIERPDSRNWAANRIRPAAGVGGIEGLPFREIVGEDIRRVRFIKIDVEGSLSEGPILEAILDALRDLPEDLAIAAEVSPSSADYVARFVAAGFRAYAIQNIYTIDYYLIRSYLHKFGEDANIHMIPVNCYDWRHSDYIFERFEVGVRAADREQRSVFV